MEGPGPCGAQGYAMSCRHVDPASEHTSDLLCCSLRPPEHPQPLVYWLVLYGCRAAAVGASNEEDCVCSVGSLRAWTGF
jgi:hypothetical protein